MRMTTPVVLFAAALVLAACSKAPEEVPPSEIVPPERVAADAQKERLSVPSESVGKDYKPAEINLKAPPENKPPSASDDGRKKEQ